MSVDLRREQRHMVHVAGRYRPRHGNSRDIWIKDLSEYGCRFFDKFSVLELGKQILVRIDYIGPIPAEVKWRDRSNVGVEFESALHPSVMTHIIRELDQRDAP